MTSCAFMLVWLLSKLCREIAGRCLSTHVAKPTVQWANSRRSSWLPLSSESLAVASKKIFIDFLSAQRDIEKKAGRKSRRVGANATAVRMRFNFISAQLQTIFALNFHAAFVQSIRLFFPPFYFEAAECKRWTDSKHQWTQQEVIPIDCWITTLEAGAKLLKCQNVSISTLRDSSGVIVDCLIFPLP